MFKIIIHTSLLLLAIRCFLFGRRQPMLPFAVNPDLNAKLVERINQLETIESEVLTNIISDQSVHMTDVEQFVSTVDLLLEGAELHSDQSRTTRLRELKSGLELRIQRFNEWRESVESVLDSTDHLLAILDTQAIIPDQLPCSVRYPAAPYAGNVASHPLINTTKLVQGHWFGFSEHELTRLADSVASSIRVTVSCLTCLFSFHFVTRLSNSPKLVDILKIN